MLPFAAIAGCPAARLAGVPAGLMPLLAAGLAAEAGTAGRRLVVIASDEAAARAILDAAPFFAPQLHRLWLPAWDCLPYDRASPAQTVLGDRLAALHALLAPPAAAELLVTTVSAAAQRLLPKEVVAATSLHLAAGQRIARDGLLETLARAGYQRAETAVDAGDYAVRGGLIDLIPPGATSSGFRIDFFGDEIETIRRFDALSQRSSEQVEEITLCAVSELLLDDERIRRFRARWLERFGADATTDPLYQAASEGRRVPGLEHYLPLFEERLVSFFDWLAPDDLLLLDGGAPPAAAERFHSIADYFHNRSSDAAAPRRKGETGSRYRALPPALLYLSPEEWQAATANACHASPLPGDSAIPLAAGPAEDFLSARQGAAGGSDLYRAIAARLDQARAAGRRPVLAAYSDGSRARILALLGEAGVPALAPAASWAEAQALAATGTTPLVVLPLEHGFRLPEIELWTEQDLLGERLVRRRSARKADAFLKDLQSLEAGELVVHQEHGIGRYLGLVSIPVDGAEHDTVALQYLGGDKLYVPVENLDVLSRYGSDSTTVALDKLGGVAWQHRKARMKERIREIAHQLLRTAAHRATHQAERIAADSTGYPAFVGGFPWVETDDQLRAADEVLADLESGRPMDRLICGDVGFGKTEVALRAAYVAAAAGLQVAVICPTTLLARQHGETFRARFHDSGLRVGVLSRLVPAAEARATRDGLADGQVDVVVGTHALLSKSIHFKRLGLVVVDEEQRFGVAHKERLKALRDDVHVLTLTATPIPRTLQMALSGIRELSVIATPPVDRLAVRTTFAPFDPVVVREALLREHYRGGQSFFVVPRISDLPDIEAYLRDRVPEVRFGVAHGQMAASEIDRRMLEFTEGRFDVLLSTTIIESGIDIPNANTLVAYRADMFGLAQLYQLRGRVGRAKRRAYALLTTAADGNLTASAAKRLRVLASLDSLGAGFELASHDLDQRGAGNLLGDEQSGHIREVGFELYQAMLEDAILAARAEEKGLKPPEDPGSPTISVDAPVLIPEDYVPDLSLRMALYRRAADLADRPAIDSFAAELIDRFGPLPDGTRNLLQIVEARNAARAASIARIEVGPKGALVTFRDDRFPNPLGLVEWIGRLKGQARLRPDQKLFLARDFGSPEGRLKGALALARGLRQAAEIRPMETKPAPAAKKPPAPGSYHSKGRKGAA